MRLTEADLPAIPCAAAWFDRENSLVANTPEWNGSGLGTVAFRSGPLRLLVSPDESNPDVAELTAELLAELSAAVTATSGDHQRRLRMLVAGLNLVAGGAADGGVGGADDLAALLTAGVAVLNPQVDLSFGTWPSLPIESPAVTALALKQLVANAQRHDGAATVRLTLSPGPLFTLQWSGNTPLRPVRSSREQSRRDRWGLGYVWQAADALGGVALAPYPSATAPSQLEATLDLNPASRRLALPLAAVQADDHVERATASWDQETRMTPGTLVVDDVRDAVSTARMSTGSAVRVGAFAARHVGRRTWVCLRPGGIRHRALDVLKGLVHEHDLLRAPEPHRTYIVALSFLLRAALGEALPEWDAEVASREFPRICAAIGLGDVRPPNGKVIASPDPMVAAYLLATLGGEITVADRRWTLRPEAARRAHPLVRLLSVADGTIPLSGSR